MSETMLLLEILNCCEDKQDNHSMQSVQQFTQLDPFNKHNVTCLDLGGERVDRFTMPEGQIKLES